MSSELIVVTKSPDERRIITFDFSSEVVTGDALTALSATITIAPVGELTASTPVVDAVNALVNVRVLGGVEGSSYTVTCRVNTDAGDILEISATVSVSAVTAGYDVTSLAGRVRLFIADTVSPFTFNDDEIDAFLALNENDVLMASASALRTLAVNKAKFAVYYSINGFTMDRRNAADKLLALADKYEEQAESAPFEFESVMEYYIDTFGRDVSNYTDTRP